MKYGPLDVKGSLNTSSYKNMKFSSNNMNMIVTVDYTDRLFKIRRAVFIEKAIKLAEENPALFRAYNGDRYLHEVAVGGVLSFIYTVKSSSSSLVDKSKLESALKVSYKTAFTGMNLDLAFTQENITEEEFSNLNIPTKTFYIGTLHTAEVKDYDDFTSLKDRFIAEMNSR
ncbi:MAG: hypothetical protein GY756_13440 [bacterium]|nr:hypothetical protein [bacterium]